MKLSSRSARTLLLGTVLAAALSSCDYRWSPGENPQFKYGFTNAPGWHSSDVNRDSINYQQNVNTPIGVGSATAIKNGTVQDQLNSAPAGSSVTSPQTASGQMGESGSGTTQKTGTSGQSGM